MTYPNKEYPDEHSHAHNSMMEIEDRIRHKFEELDRRLLSEEEVKGLRTLMEQDARARWLWASLRIWVLSISAILALLTVGMDGFRTILRRLVS
jgi:hypothetical protein